MKCAFCGKKIAEEVGQTQRCGQCGGACHKIHCPHCGYATPVVPNFLKRWMKKDEGEPKT